MSIGPTSQCSTCLHYRSPFSRDDFDGGPFCSAFPGGIPDVVLANQVDHRMPYPGDHGVQWEADGDAEFPEWALST